MSLSDVQLALADCMLFQIGQWTAWQLTNKLDSTRLETRTKESSMCASELV